MNQMTPEIHYQRNPIQYSYHILVLHGYYVKTKSLIAEFKIFASRLQQIQLIKILLK